MFHSVDQRRAYRMRSPKLDQKTIEVLPFWEEFLLDTGRFVEPSVLMNGDSSEILGLDGLKCREDPPNAWHSNLKRYFLEVRGLGEIEWS